MKTMTIELSKEGAASSFIEVETKGDKVLLTIFHESKFSSTIKFKTLADADDAEHLAFALRLAVRSARGLSEPEDVSA